MLWTMANLGNWSAGTFKASSYKGWHVLDLSKVLGSWGFVARHAWLSPGSTTVRLDDLGLGPLISPGLR